MRRNLFATLLALLVAQSAFAVSAGQQNRRAAAPARGQAARPATTAPAQAVPLPASDAVLLVDMRKLWAEAVPRALAGDAEREAQVKADIEQFKARTGIDARAFESLAVGSRIVRLESGATKIDHVVAVARGTFDTAAVVAAGRSAPGGSYSAEQHAGKTVHVFGVNDQLKVFGLLKLRVSRLAVVALDASTLAVGEPEAVRAALDAQAGRGVVSAALLNSARAAGGVVSFAGSVAPSTFAGIDVGMPELSRSIESIRGFQGSVGMSATGFTLTTALRSASAADAQRLGNTVAALRTVAPGLISMAGERGRSAKAAIESLKITTQGTEVQLRAELAQADFAALLRAL